MENKKFKLVISSGKGGVGKSMLTSVLAMLFAKERKVVAADCDADAPNLGIWLGIPPSAKKGWDKTLPVSTSAKPEIDYKKCDGCGLCAKKCNFRAIKMVKSANGGAAKPVVNPFLCEGCGACEILCPKKAIKLKPVQNGEIKIKNKYTFKKGQNFPLVTGSLFPGETGSGKVVEKIKGEAEKFEHQLMIIDSSPGTGCPVIAALRDADFVVLLTEPTPSGFADLKRVLEVVEHFKVPYGVVINKWDINPELSQKIEEFAKENLLGKISYDKKVFRAVSNLRPILETDLKAKREIKQIYNKMNLWKIG